MFPSSLLSGYEHVDWTLFTLQLAAEELHQCVTIQPTEWSLASSVVPARQHHDLMADTKSFKFCN